MITARNISAPSQFNLTKSNNVALYCVEMFKPFGLALINVAQTVDETPVFELYYESLAANDQWCSSFLNFSKLVASFANVYRMF